MIVILDRYGFLLEVGIYCNWRYGNNSNNKIWKLYINYFFFFEILSVKV